MKSRLLAALVAVGLLCISAQANANGFLSMLGGGYGGGACGCDVAPNVFFSRSATSNASAR